MENVHSRVFPADSSVRRSLGRVVACVFVTRLLLWAVSYCAVHFGHPELNAQARHDFGQYSTIAAWLRWDVWWYVSIVETGYTFSARVASSVAFLPGFPLLIELARSIVPNPVLAGLVVANVSFFGAVLALWSWVSERAGLAAAERAVLALLLYPLSFFLNTVYAEAPFFLLCVLALRAADRGKWVTAGGFACAAALVRPMGIFLAPALAVGALQARRAGRLGKYGALAPILPVLALGGYAAYLWVKHGSPLAVLTAQQLGWDVGGAVGPFHLPRRHDIYSAILDLFHLILPLALAVSSVRAWRRFGPVSGVYAVLSAALGILFGWESLGREALAVVPAFAVAGIGRRGSFPGWMLWGPAVALLIVFTYAFALGRFMG